MPIIQRPTKEELQAILEDIRTRRSVLMDKYGLLGGGETVNIVIDGLNKMYDKTKAQIDNYGN